MPKVPAGDAALVGVIGHPIAHSLSPAMHNAGFAALGLTWHYTAFDVEAENVGKAIAGARALGVRGLNVTTPHKAAAALEMDRCVGVASEIGFVNTIVFDENGAVGHSTDGEGFLRACADQGWTVGAGMRAVVVGAGGAGVSVSYALLGSGAAVLLANRDVNRLAVGMTRLETHQASKLHGKSRLHGMALGDPGFKRELATADLLVIAAPPSAELSLDLDTLHPGARVLDLAYVPEETPIAAAARTRGLEAASGLGMLVHQGALSFTLWTGLQAPVATMAAAVGYTMPRQSASSIPGTHR